MVQEQADLVRMRVQLVNSVFTPGTPITDKDSLAGRGRQIRQMVSAVVQTGRHAIIYGDRGVGKTSLAGLVEEFFSEEVPGVSVIVPRINCGPLDDYATIWAHVAEAILKIAKDRRLDIGNECYDLLERVAEGEGDPNLVRRCLDSCGSILIIIIDEFDRLKSAEPRMRFADTIKDLADHQSQDTVILVGVSESVGGLVQDHASIARSLEEILVPRLERADVRDFVKRGFESVGMSIDDSALGLISILSDGLPWYVHVLGQTSGIYAIDNGSKDVTHVHVAGGLKSAIDNALESVRRAYNQATTSPRKDTLHKQVLFACAQAKADEMGYFYPGDVREPLSKLMRRDFTIDKFLAYIQGFCTEQRGNVLESNSGAGRTRYRFTDPQMRPHVLILGHDNGWLDQS